MNAPKASETADLATAGLLRRLVAVALDTIPAAFVVALCFAMGWLDSAIFRPPADWFWSEWLFKFWLDDRGALVLPVLVLIGVAIGWTTLWEAVSGRSPGARILQLLVVDKSALRISAARAVVRGLGSLVNVATLGLGYLWVFVSSYRRGWHDYLAGTVVVVDPVEPKAPDSSKTVGASGTDTL